MKPILVGTALLLALSGSASTAVAAPAASSPLFNVKLLQVTLPSRDLSRSNSFYRDVLGLPLLFQVKGAAFFGIAGVRLRLEASPSSETVQRSATSDLKLLEFLDPDGNALALMGEVRR